MKAGEISLEAALDGVRQYHVPLFQRSYSWKERNWNELWNDLLETAHSPLGRKHFFGAIVSKSETVPQSSVTRYLLVDGQQRLTTIFVILAALRDEAKRRGDVEMAEDIEQELLFNHRKKKDDYWKLWPTRDDRATFEAVMRGQELLTNAKGNAPTGSHPLAVALLFFRRRIARSDATSLETLKETLLKRFEIVAVQLGADDDPHRIFESLNAKHERLNQADLIRNYFLMRLSAERQEELYNSLWQPMQTALGEKLSDFVRHFLSKDGELINKGDVYYTVRETIQNLRSEDQVEEYLREFAQYADFYARFLDPTREPDAQLRAGLDRIRRIQVSVAYPFLLHVFAARQTGEIDSQIARDVVETIENFALRRWACGVPTFGLNNIFPPLWREARGAISNDLKRINEGLQYVLSSKKFPSNAEFREKLITAELYGPGERLPKVEVILERLEASFGHKEAVSLDNLTVEHFMPQTLTQEWKQELGNDWQAIHANWLHTLGNLSLTAYNSELSNARWEKKRQSLSTSHVELNREAARQNQWSASQIESRGSILAERALKIWPSFGAEQEVGTLGRSVKNTIPYQVHLLGDIFAVTSWREVAQLTVETMLELSPDGFKAIAAMHPNLLSSSEQALRTPRRLKNGWFLETNLDANTLYRLAERAARRAELGIDEWRVDYRAN